MEVEKVIKELLNKALELLSSGKEQKQKQGFHSLRTALGWDSMEAFYYEGICYKNWVGIY